MKKIITAIFLLAVMVVSLTACDPYPTNDSQDEGEQTRNFEQSFEMPATSRKYDKL